MKTNKDTLLAIWVLAKLGWSNRRIARLVLPSSHHTITDYYSEACELMEAGELPISTKGERSIWHKYVGGTKDIEGIEGAIRGNQCGGGRRAKPHTYSDEWMEEGD
jgi:hypothetical protein